MDLGIKTKNGVMQRASSLFQHSRPHHSFNFSKTKSQFTECICVCEDCGKNIRGLAEYAKHRRRVHGVHKPYTCSFCPMTFALYSSLQVHNQTHVAQQAQIEKQNRANRKEKLRAGTQNQSFGSTENVAPCPTLSNTIKEKKYACSSCGKAFYKAYHLQRHKEVHLVMKPFTCLDCGRCFRRASHMQIHQHQHIRQNLYCCTSCGKAFSKKDGLLFHQQSSCNPAVEKEVPQSEFAHKCSCCSESFMSVSQLKVHQRRCHTLEEIEGAEVMARERKFACLQCEKAFSYASGLSHHKRIHHSTVKRNGVQVLQRYGWFYCTLCDKSFRHASGLAHHKRFKHRNQVETNNPKPLQRKQFSCQICHSIFWHAEDLLDHKKLHHSQTTPKDDASLENGSRYPCPFCDRVFRHSSTLSHHKQLHAEMKGPFRCSVCTNCIGHSGLLRLRLQMRKANGNLTYHCLVCSRTFCIIKKFIKHCERHLQQNRNDEKPDIQCPLD
ncbi:ZFP62 protein, partial [Polypterus senegalus]